MWRTVPPKENSKLNLWLSAILPIQIGIEKPEIANKRGTAARLNKYLPNPVTEWVRTLDFKYPKTPRDQFTDIIIALRNAF